MTRQELYELVWSRPLRQLAKDLQLSDVALAKRCRRLNIPLPGRGYWARVTAGQRPPRAPLPECSDTENDGRPLFLSAPPQPPNTELRAASNPVKRTALALGRPWVKDLNWERGGKSGPLLQLDVSDDLADRALLLCEHLLTSAESRGWRFISRSPPNASNVGCLLVDDEPLTFRIIESRRRVAKAGSVIRAGQLSLHVSATDSGAPEQIYKDYKRESLEAQIPSILKGCLDLAKHIKAARERRQQAQTELHHRQLRAKEIADRRHAHTQLIQQLETQATAWLRARLLRSYLRALKRANPQSPAHFIEWAKHYIDQLDPLSPTPRDPAFRHDRSGFLGADGKGLDELLRVIGHK